MNQPRQGQIEKGSQPHDFEAQKQGHQRIRNDPDYDDWTYGTEPLPQESWSATTPAESSPDASFMRGPGRSPAAAN